MPPDQNPNPEIVDELLTLPDHEQRAALLRDAGLLDAEGLDHLLDIADGFLKSDPDKAQRLAELCAGIVDQADAPAAVPRANYILAEAYVVNGDFDTGLRLIKDAHDGYAALGMHLEALRTNVGEMVAHLELGHYQEALDTGRVVLAVLDGKSELEVVPTQQQADLLTALVQQNRGRCLEYMGRYEEVLDAYAVAEKHYRDLDMIERLGEILDNRGFALSYLGRGNEALASHKAAAGIFDEAGLTLSHAMSLSNVGGTYLRLADYMSSLNAFEQARRLLGSLDANAEEYFRLRNTADAYLALNLHSEALTAYQEVDSLLEGTGMERDRALTLWGMGSALMSRLELGRAEEVLIEAARLFAAAHNAPMLSGVMLEQASAQAIRGDTESALTTARQALDLVSEDDWPVQQTYAHLRLADLLLPVVAEAEPHLLEARRLVDRVALPQLRYRLNERLGRLLRLQGRDEEAQALLEAAVSEIEHLRGTVTQETMRASFLQDKVAAYEDLLQLYLASDAENLQRAFTVAERAKSRALADLIVGVVEKSSAAAEDDEIEERLRVLQVDLNATYSRMLGGAEDGQGVPISDLQDRAAGIESEISRLRLQAGATSTDPFAASVSPEEILERLPLDATLLAYHVVEDEVLAFVNANGQVRVARHLSTPAKVRDLLERLAVQWDRVQAGREFAGRHISLLERSARQVLSALYDELVAPLELLLEYAGRDTGVDGPVRKLVVVPHGLLHQVPFQALFDGERYLLERFEVSYAPSATVYALCQERASRDGGGALVMGVEDPLIPAAMDEARTVARGFSEARLRIGDEATVAALRSDAPGCGVVHLACHGMFRADNPMFSSLKLHDGWLTAADAVSLDLEGALVVLSACESGRGGVIGGDEVLGLVRAFLGAGTATLVVSQWLVQDSSTAELMEGWYARLRDGEGRTAALRAAQLEIKERYPHPYYWAPFVLIGKR